MYVQFLYCVTIIEECRFRFSLQLSESWGVGTWGGGVGVVIVKKGYL